MMQIHLLNFRTIQTQDSMKIFLWRACIYLDPSKYILHEVMRQEDRVFSSILTKIGSGSQLSLEETNIIESRMFTEDEAKQMCPSGIRLFFQVKTESLTVM
ncbi:unnamed protein product [Colias eurytheme]|nr:unnamed protein product [Colias eurytheme]